MTDRISAITVYLDDGLREDSPEFGQILNAIRSIKGVRTAETHVHDLSFVLAEAAALSKAKMALIDAAVEAANGLGT